MTKKEEIKEYLMFHNIYDALEKYDNIEELNIILEIVIEKRYFYDVSTVLLKFPKNNKSDLFKENVLSNYVSHLNSYEIREIICSIFNDQTKLKLLYEYFDFLSKNNEIVHIIDSLNDDTLKVNQFRKNIKYYDSESFSDYLKRIKDSSLRTKEFLLYKEQFPDFRLDWIALSYSTDESKYYIFNKFYDETKKEQISYFITNLKSDKFKLKCIDRYVDSVNTSGWYRIVTSFKTSNNIAYIIKKYANKIKSYDLQELILKIPDELLRLELLDNIYQLMKSEDIVKIIRKIKNNELKSATFKKYINIFNQEDWYHLYLDFNYEDEEKYKKFIIQYIDYFDNEFLFYICSHHISWSEYNMVNWVLNNYIHLFNPIDLSKIISMIIEKKDSINIEILSQKLLSNVTDKRVEKIICNAISLYDYQYFENKLYNNKQIFSVEERKICDELSINNPCLFKFFVFELLDIPNLTNNFTFFKTLAKYPEVAQKVVDIHKNNPQNTQLLLSLIEIIFQFDINYDYFINSLIKAFLTPQNKLLSNLDVNKLDRDSLIKLIYKLINVPYADSNFIDVDIRCEEDLKAYDIVLTNKIDKAFLSADNLNDAKNALLNKIFGISITKAQQFISMYGFSIEKISEEDSIKYIKIIKNILEAGNVYVLKRIYNTYSGMSIEEKILLEPKIKKTYNQIISDCLYDISSKEPISYLNKRIPVYVPDDEFYLLVNSLSAYRNKEVVDDYNKFWNNNVNIQNHGICCSLISNQNVLQTAPVNDVIVGFSSFSDNAIQLANSNDIGTKNDKFNMTSFPVRFMLPQDFIDNTIGGYNEFVLERRELRNGKNYKYDNIQPSYVIVYDTFDDNQVARSFKAACELNVPVLFLDTQKIYFNEYQTLEEYKQSLMNNMDINVFEKLIIRFENNLRSLLSNSNGNTLLKYFSKEKMTEFIEEFFLKVYILVQEKRIDKKHGVHLFEEIIIILQKEQEKYRGIDKPFDKDNLIQKALYYIDLIKLIEDNKTMKTNR